MLFLTDSGLDLLSTGTIVQNPSQKPNFDVVRRGMPRRGEAGGVEELLAACRHPGAHFCRNVGGRVAARLNVSENKRKCLECGRVLLYTAALLQP